MKTWNEYLEEVKIYNEASMNDNKFWEIVGSKLKSTQLKNNLKKLSDDELENFQDKLWEKIEVLSKLPELKESYSSDTVDDIASGIIWRGKEEFDNVRSEKTSITSKLANSIMNDTVTNELMRRDSE